MAEQTPAATSTSGTEAPAVASRAHLRRDDIVTKEKRERERTSSAVQVASPAIARLGAAGTAEEAVAVLRHECVSQVSELPDRR